MGGIDLDPASSAEAQKTIKAKKFFSAADDGLGKKWRGRVWLNASTDSTIAPGAAGGIGDRRAHPPSVVRLCPRPIRLFARPGVQALCSEAEAGRREGADGSLAGGAAVYDIYG